MNKFTPGPWWVEERFADRQVIVSAKIDERVSVVVAAGGSSSIEQLANARLIAAAPDLYEALQRLVRHDEASDIREGLPNCVEVEAARVALAKAEGR